jgi:hypothetical protein
LKEVKVELYNDNFQNYKKYNIPRANLVLADIPYNIGDDISDEFITDAADFGFEIIDRKIKGKKYRILISK